MIGKLNAADHEREAELLRSQLDRMEVSLAREVRIRADLERSMRREFMETSMQAMEKADELLNNTSVLSDIPFMGMVHAADASTIDHLPQHDSQGNLESGFLVRRSERRRIEAVTERIKRKILERGWDLGGI